MTPEAAALLKELRGDFLDAAHPDCESLESSRTEVVGHPSLLFGLVAMDEAGAPTLHQRAAFTQMAVDVIANCPLDEGLMTAAAQLVLSYLEALSAEPTLLADDHELRIPAAYALAVAVHQDVEAAEDFLHDDALAIRTLRELAADSG